MNYLSVENVSKSFGERTLFKELYFGLNRGDKTALVANNGAGKTSLLYILAGKEQPDTGKVSIRNGIRVGYLEQEPVFDESKTVGELLEDANSTMSLVVKEYEHALQRHSEIHSKETEKAFEVATAKMDELEAWDYEQKAKTILSKFNINNHALPIKSLSGGQRKRLALALVLIDNPELLVLDEPTNHLDVQMIEWLEEHLQTQKITFLMVTHDRYFLDRVCNGILELNDGVLYFHKGNYSYFLEKRAEREEAFGTEIAKAGKLMKQELEWIRRMPKARGTKSKARIDAFYQTKEKAMSGKTAKELQLQVKMSRIGGKILEIKKAYKQYGDKLILKGFDYTFKKGERIGIVGVNGVGKSTFLNIITGKEQPDSGKVNIGDTVVYGYYSQQGIQLKEDKRVIEVVKDIADYIDLGDGTKLMASQFLQHFLFPPEMQYTYVSKLSGGEKRRLYLLTVLIKNPNFLILDEPTNDLDLLTLNKLEEFLMQYKGCLIMVSHDRYFMDKLVDHLFVFEGEGVIRDFNGTYSEYREEELEKEEHLQQARKQEQDLKIAASDSNKKISEPTKKKLTFKEKQEYEFLEKEIAALEAEKKELTVLMDSSETGYEQLTQAANRISEIIALTDEKTMRWLELSEWA